MRMYVFAGRNMKEVFRDPLTLFFGAVFPLVLLFLLSAIQANIPVAMFEIDKLTPGIAAFGHSFLALFAGMLIAKDRTSALTLRLFASPLKKWEFIAGYALPMLPLAIIQALLCLLTGCIMGMRYDHLVIALFALLPSAIVFIAIGLLVGCLLNDKQVGGICGALLTNLSAWLSGIWFDVSLVGGAFEKIADILPFSHSVKAAQLAVIGDISGMLPHMAIVSAYGLGLLLLAIGAFRKNKA